MGLMGFLGVSGSGGGFQGFERLAILTDKAIAGAIGSNLALVKRNTVRCIVGASLLSFGTDIVDAFGARGEI